MPRRKNPPPNAPVPPATSSATPEPGLHRPTGPLVAALGAVLALLAVLDLTVTHKAYFAIGKTFAFAAWYGLAAALVLLVVAKVIGVLLNRPDSYYDR